MIYSKDSTHKQTVTHAGWGYWVYHNELELESSINRATKSSCMTNEQGPIKYRFTTCDLDELVGGFSRVPVNIFHNLY